MKKVISLFLAAVLLITAIPFAFTAAAEKNEFVIDGQLDEWYRDDDWAVENKCFFYYTPDISDATYPDEAYIEAYSKKPGSDNGVTVRNLNEDVTVKIYSAYDEKYAYFFVDVDDKNIPSTIIDPSGKETNSSQYMECIDFWVDTDVMSHDLDFENGNKYSEDSTTHFRILAHNGKVTDTQGANVPKYQLIEAGEGNNNASAFFGDPKNVAYTQKKDGDALVGYTVEARFPLAYQYVEEFPEDYWSYTFSVAVTNSATSIDEEPVGIATNKQWWRSMNEAPLVSFIPTIKNPFTGNAPEVATPDDATPPDATEDEPSTPPAPQYTRGDVDANGNVNATDALWVLQYSVNKRVLDETAQLAANVNGDQKIDAADALGILKIVVGKDK